MHAIPLHEILTISKSDGSLESFHKFRSAHQARFSSISHSFRPDLGDENDGQAGDTEHRTVTLMSQAQEGHYLELQTAQNAITFGRTFVLQFDSEVRLNF